MDLFSIVIGIIIGICIGSVLTIIDSIFEIILQFLELLKIPFIKKTLISNIEIQKMQEELQVLQTEQSTYCVGFDDGSGYYEEYDEDEYWEEDKKNKALKFQEEMKNKDNKIG